MPAVVPELLVIMHLSIPQQGWDPECSGVSQNALLVPHMPNSIVML